MAVVESKHDRDAEAIQSELFGPSASLSFFSKPLHSGESPLLSDGNNMLLCIWLLKSSSQQNAMSLFLVFLTEVPEKA